MNIPLHLVTGFLGSGKTTFLQHFLKNFSSTQRIAVVQNEFAPVNVDGAILKDFNDYQILEINNGSVFCVCLLGSFIESLEAFILQHQPEVIIMEASGLSDTLGVGQIFQSPQLRGKVHLEHIWCLVDAVNYQRSIKQRFEHQVRSADTIVLNKTDLVNGTLSELTKELKTLNPYATLVETSYAQVELKNIIKKPKFFQQKGNESLGRPDIASYIVKSSQKINANKLGEFLNKYALGCYRYKGFVHTTDNKTLMVQGVFDSFKVEEVSNYNGPSELVLIGEIPTKENLQIAFQYYCK